MVGAAVLKLCGGDINDALPCAVWNQMHEAEQILAGITKSHPAPDAGLVVGGRAAHVKCHHALILVPDIDHTVYLVIGGFHDIAAEQIVPVGV